MHFQAAAGAKVALMPKVDVRDLRHRYGQRGADMTDLRRRFVRAAVTPGSGAHQQSLRIVGGLDQTPRRPALANQLHLELRRLGD